MYYDICIAEQCNCIYDDTDNIKFLCINCKKIEDKNKTTPWYFEINTIQNYLYNTELTDNINIRIIIIKKLFEFLLTREEFIAKSPKFRESLLSKIDQFKNDEQAKELHSLCENLKIFINSLEEKDNYIK
jgi:hypothetical protein